MKTNHQRGFTLIELIVVIVILGILSATALPKFINIGADARRSVMQGVEASMRGANTMVYAKAAANGALGAAGTVQATSSISVTTVYGYAQNVNATTGLSAVLELSPASDFTIANGYIRHAKATTPASCQIAYTAATSTVPPVYTPTLNGC